MSTESCDDNETMDKSGPASGSDSANSLAFRPDMGTEDELVLITDMESSMDSTAELAANAPRYRRRSSTFIDGIHDVPDDQDMAPAQLYSTMSGRLFHCGRIVIVMVGLPARGKTHISVSMARYLQWLGVKTRIFHLGDYRRATVEGGIVPEDYFFPHATPGSLVLRQKILKKCREDMYSWLNHDNGQVAIYDAVNPQASGRRALAKEFAKHDVQSLFIESYVDDERILYENARNVKISSPDFVNMDPDEAAKLYLKRIEMKIPFFEQMDQSGDESDLNYIRMINAGQKFLYNDVSFNYLSHRIVFYLTNLHVKNRSTYFIRAGPTVEEDAYRSDAPLSEVGHDYARKMADTLLPHRQRGHARAVAETGIDAPIRALSVWTSTRLNTIQTADVLKARGFKVRQRSQMSQINLGVCEKMSERVIRHLYPEEVGKHEKDPYHHRYPRAESYHDLAVRLEPIILELEREENDLLIIAHESVLRVLYAYLMHCSTMDIPLLKFPRNEIIEIIPAAYQNQARRIMIPDVDPSIVPGSPDDVRIPAPAEAIPAGGNVIVGAESPESSGSESSTATITAPRNDPSAASTAFVAVGGAMSPVAAGKSSSPVIRPMAGSTTSDARGRERAVSMAAEMVADKVDDED